MANIDDLFDCFEETEQNKSNVDDEEHLSER